MPTLWGSFVIEIALRFRRTADNGRPFSRSAPKVPGILAILIACSLRMIATRGPFAAIRSVTRGAGGWAVWTAEVAAAVAGWNLIGIGAGGGSGF